MSGNTYVQCPICKRKHHRDEMTRMRVMAVSTGRPYQTRICAYCLEESRWSLARSAVVAIEKA